MSQTTLDGSDLQALIGEKRDLEKKVEYFRHEFKEARRKARDNKKLLREITAKIRLAEGK